MKQQLLTTVLIGFASLLLVACGGPQSTGQQTAGQQSSATNGALASAETKTVRATLTVVPGGVSTCEKDAHVNPTVTWQRIDTAVKNTKVTVSSPGSSDEKLFATGGFGGSAKAGDWVVPGVVFNLYDADTGSKLASYTMLAKPCQQ